MKSIYLSVFLVCLYAPPAQAEIYKRVDASGHVTYSSEPIKGGKKLNLEPLPVMQAPRRSSEGPKDFPRVDSQTQKNRDSTRRAILEDELASEEKLLAEARQNLSDAEASPEVYKGADGKTYRNVAKYEEKVKAARDDVTTHEKNIDALKTELANLH
ncbi:MAG TPA: DUF4124 domain-containing protein [Gallionellaceae bacterium]|nr:DUF4124 domain-containing protein [Gallionellaceae bacterium]